MVKWMKRIALVAAVLTGLLGPLIAVNYMSRPQPSSGIGNALRSVGKACAAADEKNWSTEEIAKIVDAHNKKYVPARLGGKPITPDEEHSRAVFRGCNNLSRFEWAKVGDELPFAEFTGANLTRSIFGNDFSKRKGLGFQDTGFLLSRLDGAWFMGVNLRNARFTASSLDGAHFLDNADLTGASFLWASVAGLVFEPRGELDYASFRTATDIELMTYRDSADALIQLREAFKKAGRRDLERRVTYAIETTKTNKLLAQNDIVGVSRLIAWGLPTAYDLSPERALLLLFIYTVLFALPYWWSLGARNDPRIWKVFPAQRLHGDGKVVFEPVHAGSGLKRVGYALMFSVFSAFTLGWRDLNVGMWLSRLQGDEYALRGSGWVRTLSGVQSLLSVYLLAMWALTQFGRLFEG